MSDINQITRKLLGQGLDTRSASMVATELTKVSPSLQKLVRKWIAGEQLDYSSNGYSVFGLMKSRRMTYPAALLTIDWIIKEPDKAIASLKKGVK